MQNLTRYCRGGEILPSAFERRSLFLCKTSRRGAAARTGRIATSRKALPYSFEMGGELVDERRVRQGGNHDQSVAVSNFSKERILIPREIVLAMAVYKCVETSSLADMTHGSGSSGTDPYPFSSFS